MTEHDERQAEHPGCVLGITLGLLLAAALTGIAVVASGRMLDADVLLRESFAFDELPFGLVIVEAAALPGGVRLVRLAHPDHVVHEPEPEEPEDDLKADPAKSADGGAPAYVPIPPRPEMIAGTPPTEVFFAFYADPKASVEAFIGGRELGGDRDFERGGEGRGQGMQGGPGMQGDSSAPIVMDNGDLLWGVLRSGFIHERRYEQDFGRDEVRVNLSTPGHYCVLSVRWPKNHAGSRARAEELLSTLSLRNG